MALSLKDIQEVLSPLSELGVGEDTFEAGGIPISIRTLTPDEEIAIQRYARGAITEGDANDQVSALEYLDRFRSACLGYAVMRLGGLDFHGVTTIETGDVLPSGVAVKVKKHEAIMQAIKPWSRPMVMAVYQKFTDLMDRVEETVEKSIAYDDDHIDAQIARLEERLSELKAAKSKVDAGKTDPRKDIIEIASDRPTTKEPPSPKEPPVTWEKARTEKVSSDSPLVVDVGGDIPKALTDDDAPSEAAPPPTRQSVFGERPAPRESREPVDPLRDVSSSLVDTNDPSVIDAENRRIMAERARRTPPHLSAREVAHSVGSIEQNGTMDGVPVFKMPTENLTKGSPPPPQRTPPPVSRNPNFRPVK